MLRLIAKASPTVLILSILSAVMGAVQSFLLNTYLYQYALNALQEGKALGTILLTLGCMVAYSLFYMLFQSISRCVQELKRPRQRPISTSS